MKILLIDHHELFRDGLRHVLQKLPSGLGELLVAGNWMAGLKCVELQPYLDLILLEPGTPGCNGAEPVEFLRKRYPHIPVLVVSGGEDFHLINKVLSCGASGFVGKSSPEATFLNAMKSVLAGNIYVPPNFFCHDARAAEGRLTRRQEEILGCLAEGLTNKEISDRFDIAEGTIKVHVAAVYQALHVKGRHEAASVAGRLGLGRQRGESVMAC